MKIALFVGQIYIYTQREIIKGVYEECRKNNDELHLFSFYVSNDEGFDVGEYEYIKRMELSGFDGFILYASAFYNPYIRGVLATRLKASGKPCVSIDSYDKDFFNITSCNGEAMEELVEHVITKHNVKKVNFVGGPGDSIDARYRLDACTKVLRQHGLKLPRERIYEGNYYVDSGYKAYDYFKEHDLMDADAFICVNDQSAMGVFYRLSEEGYRIPEDYIITGFDNIPQAAYNQPSITSIKRFENKIGNKAYHMLTGKKCTEVKIAPKLVIGTSCCPDCKVSKAKREGYLRECIKLSMDNSRFAGFVSDCSADFMAYRSSREMYDMLPDYQKKFNIPIMSIILDNGGKKLEMPYHYNIEKNERVSMQLKRSDIYSAPGEGNLYVYSSLHYGDSYFGYAVITNYMAAIEMELYHMFINNISNMLESARKYNAQESYIDRLKDLSYYDPLTKLYNRLGFFNKAEVDFEIGRQTDKKMFIIFADMDRLKVINDTMGHKMGDEYIVDFANILSSCIDKDELAMRFGGDEFVVFGVAESAKEVKDKIRSIQESIRDFNEKGKYSPYILGVSMGYTMIAPDTDKSLFSFIEAADGKMYLAKQEKREQRTGMDRRSGRDRRVNDRRALNDPLDFN
ncbi:MAG: GGDEF domain-containing protein [Lachnospiraceae bacterium]|nr:GGDEF domain-containing protein [Lachnospiraceae bacterium]